MVTGLISSGKHAAAEAQKSRLLGGAAFYERLSKLEKDSKTSAVAAEIIQNTKTGIVPESAAVFGLHAAKDPLNLAIPVWAAGAIGRAAVRIIARYGMAAGLATEAIAGLNASGGLVAEASGFVGVSNGVNAARGRDVDLSPGGLAAETGASTILFGGLKLFGQSAKLTATILPKTELGIAVAKLIGHNTSVVGLASMESVQEAAGIAPASSQTFYEKLVRAFFLHVTLHAASSFIKVDGIKSRAKNILLSADRIVRAVAGIWEQGAAHTAMAGSEGNSVIEPNKDKPLMMAGERKSKGKLGSKTRRPRISDEVLVAALEKYKGNRTRAGREVGLSPATVVGRITSVSDDSALAKFKTIGAAKPLSEADIEEALAEHGGNRTQAARSLNVTTTAISVRVRRAVEGSALAPFKYKKGTFGGSRPRISDEVLVAVLEKYKGNRTRAGREVGLSPATVVGRITSVSDDSALAKFKTIGAAKPLSEADIEEALAEHGGNRTQAARSLNVTTTAISVRVRRAVEGSALAQFKEKKGPPGGSRPRIGDEALVAVLAKHGGNRRRSSLEVGYPASNVGDRILRAKPGSPLYPFKGIKDVDTKRGSGAEWKLKLEAVEDALRAMKAVVRSASARPNDLDKAGERFCEARTMLDRNLDSLRDVLKRMKNREWAEKINFMLERLEFFTAIPTWLRKDRLRGLGPYAEARRSVEVRGNEGAVEFAGATLEMLDFGNGGVVRDGGVWEWRSPLELEATGENQLRFSWPPRPKTDSFLRFCLEVLGWGVRVKYNQDLTVTVRLDLNGKINSHLEVGANERINIPNAVKRVLRMSSSSEIEAEVKNIPQNQILEFVVGLSERADHIVKDLWLKMKAVRAFNARDIEILKRKLAVMETGLERAGEALIVMWSELESLPEVVRHVSTSWQRPLRIMKEALDNLEQVIGEGAQDVNAREKIVIKMEKKVLAQRVMLLEQRGYRVAGAKAEMAEELWAELTKRALKIEWSSGNNKMMIRLPKNIPENMEWPPNVANNPLLRARLNVLGWNFDVEKTDTERSYLLARLGFGATYYDGRPNKPAK